MRLFTTSFSPFTFLRRRLDPGYLLVLLIALIAIWPFISRASLPQETDAELHIFRLMELGYLVAGGEWYPRWAPDFYHGYGYPIFNYYAPLAYYAGLPLERLPWFDAVIGVKFVFVVGLLLAAVGVYGFVRDNWGRPAGYVATAVYLYAPYVQFIDPHARGVLAESLSLGVLPLALWALDRWRRTGGPGVWIGAALAVAAVILSHNLMAVLFGCLLGGWVIWHTLPAAAHSFKSRYWVEADRQTDHVVHFNSLGNRHGTAVPIWSLWLLLGLGLGLSAFFWLPLLLERNAVELDTLLGQGDNFDFRTHFLSLREMLAFPGWLDWGATEPVFRFSLGLAQWLLGGLGLLLLLLRRVAHAYHLSFFALSLALLLFLMLPLSEPVWTAVPILPYFQFPWRLLGAAALCLALLAGAATAALLSLLRPYWGERMEWITALLVALPLLLGLPLSQPAPWPDFGEVNRLRLTLLENSGRWVGTTSTADFVPATVDMLPGRNGAVVAGFGQDGVLDRVNRPTLPEGTIVEATEVTPLYFRYQVSTPEPFRLRLFLFDFPGWRTWLNGALIETELGQPEGFIVIPVPAGEHLVEVRFGSTLPRTVGWVLAGLSLLLLLSGAFLWRRPLVEAVVWPGWERPVLWTVGGITAVFLLILQPLNLLHYHSTGFEAAPAQQQVFADFGDQIALIGYDSGSRTVCPGEAIEVLLYWKAKHELAINYQVFVHLLAPDGFPVNQSDKINPGEFPTRRWPLDKYVLDRHHLVVPEGVPPGEYTLSVGLWVQTEGWRLPLVENGRQVGDNYHLFTVTVVE
ncbi:MAG: 6-pyruvoyl-tetrahydropterin synthase-related protein [Chloroflexota bacterium]